MLETPDVVPAAAPKRPRRKKLTARLTDEQSRLAAAHWPTAYRAALAMTVGRVPDRMTHEEVASNLAWHATYYAIVTSADDVDPRKNFGGYIHQCMRLSLGYITRVRPPGKGGGIPMDRSTDVDWLGRVERPHEAVDDADALEVALRPIGRHAAEVFRQRVNLRKTCREIGLAMGLSESRAERMLTGVRRALAGQLPAPDRDRLIQDGVRI